MGQAIIALENNLRYYYPVGNTYLYSSPFDHPLLHLEKSNKDNPFWKMVEFAIKKETSNSIIIVPSQLIKQSILNCLIKINTDLFPEIYTFDELILQNSHHNNKNEHFEIILLKHIIDKHPNSKTLFTKSRETVGFLNQLLTVFHDLDKFDISTTQFKKNISMQPNQAQCIIDYYEQFKAMKQIMQINSIIDHYQNLKQLYFNPLIDTFKEKNLIVLGIWALAPYQKHLLLAIAKFSKLSLINIHFQLEKQYDAAHELIKWIKTWPIPVKHINIPKKETIKQNSFKVFKAQSIEEECIFVIKKIALLLSTNSYEPTNFLIVVPKITTYSTPLKNLCREYNIPLTQSASKKLVEFPFIGIIRHFFDIALTGFNRFNIKALFRSSFIHHIKDIESGNLITINPQLLEDLAIEFQIESKYEDWEKAFIIKLTTLEAQSVSSNVSPIEKTTIEQQLLQLKNQQKLLKTIHILILNFKNIPSIEQFYTSLLQFFDHIQLLPKLKSIYQEDPIHSELLSAYFIFTEALKTFTELYTAFQTKKNNINLPQICEDFNHFISNQKVPIKTTPGVQLVGKFESYAINKKIIFICGAIDNFWPSTISENVFISNTERSKLNMFNQKNFHQWDQYLFSGVMKQAKEQTYISYPSLLDDTPVIISKFLQEILTEQKHIKTNEKIPTIFSHRETQINLGINKHITQTQKLNINTKALFRDLPEYQGQLIDNSILTILNKRWNSQSFSVSQLETYQNCPHHYFYKYILQEKCDFLPEEGISPATWGSLLHTIFHEFYETLQTKKLSIHANYEQLYELLLQIAEKIFTHYDQGTFFWSIQKQLLFDDSEKKSFLSAFLHSERKRSYPLSPSKFEFPFKNFKITHGSESLLISGKIDVVLESTEYSAVLDYKTGSKIPRPIDIDRFSNLQLPVYHLVIQSLLPTKPCIGSIIYQVKDSQQLNEHIIMVNEIGKNSIFNLGKKRPYVINQNHAIKLKQYIINLKTHIKNGHFNFLPLESMQHLQNNKHSLCKFCEFKGICKYPNRFK